MPSSGRLFALLCIVAASGCAGNGTASVPSAPFVPQSPLRNTHAASTATVFISVVSINAIESFPAGRANPVPRIAIRTGINRPTGIAVGGSGRLFVNNSGNNTVTEYPPGATKPDFTLNVSSGINNSIAAGPDDTLYVEDANGNIDLYPPGATSPSATLPNPGAGGPPYGLGALAVDKSNDVFVVGYGGSCCGIGVFEYPAASQNAIGVNGTYNMGGGLAVDGAGDLLTSPGGVLRKEFIRVIHSNGTITSFPTPQIAQMSFDAKDQYVYTTFGTVSIIDYKRQQVLRTLPHIFDAYGVAVRPATF